MTKENSTEIIVVVDRSGSMFNIADDMIGGFTSYIENQKEVPGECFVSLVLFDDIIEPQYSRLPLLEVPELALIPRGWTALYDAIGKTIFDTGERFQAMNENDRPSSVLFVIITDGLDNASKAYHCCDIFNMITHQREKYNWEFVFLGANQDSVLTASKMGISTTNSVTFDQTKTGTEKLMRGLSVATTNYRNAGGGRMENVYNQTSYKIS